VAEAKLCECGCGQPAPIATGTDPRYGCIKGQPRRFIAGHNRTRGNLHHGMTGTRELQTYCSAKQRCSDPKIKCWPHYGGRGIKFLFESFEQFFAELGPRPKGKTLDRINTNGNYEPGNVRWATLQEQAASRHVPHRYKTLKYFKEMLEA